MYGSSKVNVVDVIKKNRVQVEVNYATSASSSLSKLSRKVFTTIERCLALRSKI